MNNYNSNEWIKLGAGKHSSSMQFYCPKCDSSNMEIYGANMRWNYQRQRWQIVDTKDPVFQCFDCHEQIPYEQSTRKKNIGHVAYYRHTFITDKRSVITDRKKRLSSQCKMCRKPIPKAEGVMSSPQVIGWCKDCYYKGGL